MRSTTDVILNHIQRQKGNEVVFVEVNKGHDNFILSQYLFKTTDKTFIKAINVNAVDTTGAGDTFNGVLAVLIAEGKDIETACKYAVCASGLSVTKKGVLNAIPTREEIERKMTNE